MLLVALLIVLAIVTGAFGFIVKGALWLLVITAVLLIAAAFAGRATARR